MTISKFKRIFSGLVILSVLLLASCKKNEDAAPKPFQIAKKLNNDTIPFKVGNSSLSKSDKKNSNVVTRSFSTISNISSGVSRSDIKYRFYTILIDHGNGGDVWVVPEYSSLVYDLHADELDVIEIIMDVEDEFGFEIPDDDAEKLNTVGDFIDYIQIRLDRGSNPGPDPRPSYWNQDSNFDESVETESEGTEIPRRNPAKITYSALLHCSAYMGSGLPLAIVESADMSMTVVNGSSTTYLPDGTEDTWYTTLINKSYTHSPYGFPTVTLTWNATKIARHTITKPGENPVSTVTQRPVPTVTRVMSAYLPAPL